MKELRKCNFRCVHLAWCVSVSWHSCAHCFLNAIHTSPSGKVNFAFSVLVCRLCHVDHLSLLVCWPFQNGPFKKRITLSDRIKQFIYFCLVHFRLYSVVLSRCSVCALFVLSIFAPNWSETLNWIFVRSLRVPCLLCPRQAFLSVHWQMLGARQSAFVACHTLGRPFLGGIILVQFSKLNFTCLYHLKCRFDRSVRFGTVPFCQCL